MTASRSSADRPRRSSGSGSSGQKTRSQSGATKQSATKRSATKRTTAKRTATGRSTTKRGATTRDAKTRATGGRDAPTRRARAAVADSLASLAEQLANRIIRPLGLVILSRERIQETLDEAAERGRLTRSDAQELALLLVQRGRQQTDELLSDIERVLGQGRRQLDTATRKARRSERVDRLVRGADRARRTVHVGPSFPILGYDDLSAGQVQPRLDDLGP